MPLDAYRKSKEARKEAKEEKKLGFRRKPRTRPKRKKNVEFFGSRSSSIAVRRIKDLRDDEYKMIVDKVALMPEDRKLDIPRHHKGSLVSILGDRLAYELMKASPDMDVINEEARYVIPDKVVEILESRKKRMEMT